tara:strand:- start:770 stop:1186 length:417 start_codon:yes stop_codon:yes gene_type:complete
MGILNSKQDYIDKAQYDKQKRINIVLQSNINTMTIKLKNRDKELDKLRTNINNHKESNSSLQSIVEYDALEKDRLRKGIQELKTTNQSLADDRLLFTNEVHEIQKELDKYKIHNDELLEAIKSLRNMFDTISRVAVYE